MIRSFIFFLLFLINTFFSIIWGQNDAKILCNTKEYKQFDFWVGNWNVYNTDGKLIGTNKIVKMPNACAIQENWTSKTSKNQGTSYNYYNKTDKSWNQVWVDNSGFSLNLKGNFKNDSMVLSSDVVKTPKGNYYNQITWTKNNDNTVTQVWNYMSLDNKKVKEVFKGIYKRKKN